VKTICAATSALFVITTDATASPVRTREKRSKYAFTGSPASPAVGVMLLIASPAKRIAYSRQNGNARRSGGARARAQPSTSKVAPSA